MADLELLPDEIIQNGLGGDQRGLGRGSTGGHLSRDLLPVLRDLGDDGEDDQGILLRDRQEHGEQD